MTSKVYKRKVDTRDELIALVWDAAERIKQLEDQLRRTKRDFRVLVAKCVEVDGGIFEHLLRHICYVCVTDFVIVTRWPWKWTFK